MYAIFFKQLGSQMLFISFQSMWSNFKKLGVHELELSKIDLQWGCLPAFSYTFFCKQFKLEKPSMEKLKSKHLDRVFFEF